MIRIAKSLLAALLFGVTPLVVSAQDTLPQSVVVQATPLSPALSKACWPSVMLRGRDTTWLYVPCRSLDVLEPRFKAALQCTLARMKKGGWSPLVQETMRSDALQRRYYAKGRTVPGRRVTNAKSVVTTVHGYGMAADIISAIDGWKNPRFFYWLGQHAETCGLTAGTFWKSFPDPPHIQHGEWAGAPPQWARTLLAKDSLNLVWVRLYPE